MKARRVCGLLMFLLAALVLTPALMWLFWPVQAEALEGVLSRLGEGVVRDVLLRGYRLAQDYPRTVSVAAGAAALLGLAMLFWPARKAPAMAVGEDWAKTEPQTQRTLQFPYPETAVQPCETAEASSAPAEPAEETFAPPLPRRAASPQDTPRVADAAPTMKEAVPIARPAEATAVCPTCGAQNSARAYFCRSCGADLPQEENVPLGSRARSEAVKPHYIWENQPLQTAEASVASPAEPAISAPSPLMNAEPTMSPAFEPPAPIAAPSPLEQQPDAAWQAPAEATAPSSPLTPAPSLGGAHTRIVSTVGQTAHKASAGHLRPASFD